MQTLIRLVIVEPTHYYHSTIMPTNASVKRILSAQEMDSSLTLGLTVNGKAITTKQYISKAGESFHFAHSSEILRT